jgi:RNA polymerase sigma factor (sigma-70 family)
MDGAGTQPRGEDVERLLTEHLPGLRAFVRLRAGPRVRARETDSDVVQSTCREVLEHREVFLHGGEAGFRHWLYTTAMRKILNKHEFHDAARRDVRRDARGQAATGAPHGAGHGTGHGSGHGTGGPGASSDVELLAAYQSFCSPSRVAVAREELERIEAAFEQLPEDYREVVLHSRLMGLPRAEVARLMQRSESSVRNLLHRALAQLAGLLEPAG